ncbi:hypothetical protein ASZ90_019609 [hydrocarbon metagenome]|uniref:YetF C-terminal domain-containing protein n=1 Tax=hydrocarbon metagenome TaxID=938273 RepID=A0A0W8E332_9ZZZZ
MNKGNYNNSASILRQLDPDQKDGTAPWFLWIFHCQLAILGYILNLLKELTRLEIMKELLMVAGRIVTIIPLLLLMTLFMGKRAIGELPIFDFLVIIILGAVVGADIADPEIAHIHTAAAIVLIGIFQILVSKMKIKYRKFGHIITFEPTIVIQDGKFIVNNLRRVRYSIDNILQMLREKDVFNVSDVYLGIVEANGNLSVLKKSDKTAVTIEDIKLTKSSTSLSYPIIVDGKVYSDVLAKLDLSSDWLIDQLNNLGIKSTQEVFYASINNKRELQVSPQSHMQDEKGILPILN